MRLFVPRAYALSTPAGARREWHVLIEITDEDGHASTIHLAVCRRRYGNRMPWTIERYAGCGVAADNVRALGIEHSWRETPPAVRSLVLRDLGLAQ